MHPNRKFHILDRDEMAAIVRRTAFGMLVVHTEAGLRAVHVPVMLEGDRLRFHVSKGNLVHPALQLGCEALFVANGPDSYVSPEDYGLEDRVPTWSYVAVELNGPVTPLAPEALIRLLDDMSAEQEDKLAPKVPWTRAKMSEGRFEGLLKSITGFEMEVREWRGTAKLDQDKPAEVRARLAAVFAGRGNPAMAEAVAPAPSPMEPKP
jgi:transcriptional regulator